MPVVGGGGEVDLGKIIGRHFNCDFVSGKNFDVVLSYLARDVCQDILCISNKLINGVHCWGVEIGY